MKYTPIFNFFSPARPESAYRDQDLHYLSIIYEDDSIQP